MGILEPVGHTFSLKEKRMYNQPMRFLVFLFLFATLQTAIAAEATGGDTLRLEDGRVVRLLGIKSDSATAQSVLQKQIGGQTLILENQNMDRYGRISADVYRRSEKGEKIWLQGELLRQGLAFVYPPTGNEPHLNELLKFEQAARHGALGIWNDKAHTDLPAADPDAIPYGAFAFVSGKVVKAERIKNMVYLNFGEDWHKDFTIAIAAHDLKLFHKADIDPITYQGKTIRVRGWVKHNFGPMITVTHPAQIEILGEATAKP